MRRSEDPAPPGTPPPVALAVSRLRPSGVRPPWNADAVQRHDDERPPSGGMVIFTRDLDRLAAFYEAVLELRRSDGDATWVGLVGPQAVVVHSIPDDVAATFEVTDPPIVRDDAPIKPWFAVASITAARESAPVHGGRVLDPAQEWRFDGWLVCDGIDPEGNVIQLRERLG